MPFFRTSSTVSFTSFSFSSNCKEIKLLPINSSLVCLIIWQKESFVTKKFVSKSVSAIPLPDVLKIVLNSL